MSYSITGMTTLGTVQSEDVTKDAQLFQQPIPRTASSGAILMDIFGALRTITLKGTFVSGDGGLTVAQFTKQLDDLISGTQSATTYTSDTDSNGPFTVAIQTVNWTFEGGAPNSISYSITMYEGNVL